MTCDDSANDNGSGFNVTYDDDQHDALVAFYKATNGTYWRENKNWLCDSISYCGWEGVECAGVLCDGGSQWHCDKQRNDIVELIKDYSNLMGTIPQEIGSLVGLKRLDLDGNELKGTIPSEIGSKVGLHRYYPF
uniref:Leucine-rich repeat-containing N-terminal plant-type domain-containing protein n=1 Tax=Corethron hystrix TaxID=216773 RepID=A0A7S1BUY4_9STRA|mmetsp:Transcript_42086/g.98611  ORF Transcript_42086/g.98611 Transcript_42086/m.98611 type:complete len:134 (+) Transcript_42086:67-468(+)